jgi:formate hydrogenlyase subunit 3/multisubunit Na+/H+ antiporter MnhD subunit
MNISPLLLVIIPLVSAPFAWILKRGLREWFSVLVTLCVLTLSVFLFPVVVKAPLHYDLFNITDNIVITVNLDLLSIVIIMLISFSGFLVTLYSTKYMAKSRGLNRYYFLLLLFIGSMNGTVLSGDLFSMFLLWELMTVAAFFLVIFDNTIESIRAGIKYFVMSELGALFMLVAIIAVYVQEGTVDMATLASRGITVSSTFTHILLLFFLLGTGVKAGIIPIHTWLPDADSAVPSPVSALLSGVMIKVGIYMMIRIFCYIFSPAFSWQFILCALGSASIIVGVMMAIKQIDAKRLLAYHSVSQIGYIVLGIGTGVSVGVAGGFFHVLNHALFKGLLFLSMGAVVHRIGSRDLSNYGGLARTMPITFITCSIAALSISGVPPFNGFVSKWMIYQGLVQSFAITGSAFTIVWLAAAMFGSALTLASFVKLIYATFLAVPEKPHGVKEVSISMWIPMVIMAGLCIIFGVFAWQVPLKFFVLPVVPGVSFSGYWKPGLATVLLIITFIAGGIIFIAGRLKKATVSMPFVGGEEFEPEMGVSPEGFYSTIKNMKIFGAIYHQAEKNRFDIYHVVRNIGVSISDALSSIHTGGLPRYIIWWILAGLAILLVSLLINYVGF